MTGDVELNGMSAFNLKYKALTETIGKIIEDYSLVRFIPLNLKNHENMGKLQASAMVLSNLTISGDILITIDNTIQFGEDQDVKTKDFEEEDPDEIQDFSK